MSKIESRCLVITTMQNIRPVVPIPHYGQPALLLAAPHYAFLNPVQLRAMNANVGIWRLHTVRALTIQPAPVPR